jgi:SAM-dependent methyltransferase
MVNKRHTSTPASVFDRIYREEPDPWHYTTSLYEQTKYKVTLAVLPKERYERVFEIGCSIGVLTALLAPRCDILLAADHSSVALTYAEKRCETFKNIIFACMSIPDEFPSEAFDLILLSEVGFYWSREDLTIARANILHRLRSHGHLLLVHWTVPCKEHPLTADEVHEAFLHIPDAQLEHLLHLDAQMEQNSYRLDLFQRL